MVNKIKTASRSAKDFDFHFCCFNFTPPIFYYKSAANGQLPLKLPVRAAFCHFCISLGAHTSRRLPPRFIVAALDKKIIFRHAAAI